uniref:Uncharacterized protein n=1 Tax=Plectus sambesii TaxID=2011161 RepID=A0A914WRS6_9BILA
MAHLATTAGTSSAIDRRLRGRGAWYRKWLLVNLGKLYTFEPCKTWCDYAQLACPHLTATKAGDYAGHPSFQCTDTDFPLPVGKTSTPECDCVHPCDLQATLGDGADYFATKLHCQRRRRTCSHAPPSVPAADRSSANARARCWGGWSLSRLVWLLSVACWWTTAIGR